MLNSKVKEYLDSLEKELKVLKFPRGERCIAERINSILEQEVEHKRTKEDQAELTAFSLMVNYQSADGKRPYYRSMIGTSYTDKQASETQCIETKDQEIHKYWAKRAQESNNPILSSRYADLVVDLSTKDFIKMLEFDLFHIVIDSNIKICTQLLALPSDCKTKVRRALFLAIIRNDEKRITKLKDTIIKLEKDISSDDIPEHCGFALKWLLFDFYNKVTLSDKEEKKLANEAMERLKRVATDPLLAIDTASLLAEYYARRNDEVSFVRVLNILKDSLKLYKQPSTDEILKASAHERIFDLCKKYTGRFSEANKTHKRLLREIGKLDLDYSKKQAISQINLQVKQKTLCDHFKTIFGEDQKIEIRMIIKKIVTCHLPKRANIEKMRSYCIARCPGDFSSFHELFSDNGVPICRFDSIDGDDVNYLKLYASNYFQFIGGSALLPFTLDEFKRRFSKDKIIEYFKETSVFGNEDINYLHRTMTAYWDKDYLVSSHLLIPLIESGVRELVTVHGGSILGSNEYSGFDYHPLGALLRDEQLEKLFDANTLFYLRLILTEKLGWNLRNRFAHGLSKTKFLSRGPSDWLFHILILLSLAKGKFDK